MNRKPDHHTAETPNDWLHNGTAFSRSCRGIDAAQFPSLLYMHACHRSLAIAHASLLGQRGRATDADETAASIADYSEKVDRHVAGLMDTLIAFNLLYTQQARDVPDEAIFMVLPDDVEASQGRVADTALTPEQVFANPGRFACDASGYWMLGRLEALVAIQGILATSRAYVRALNQSAKEQLAYAIDAVDRQRRHSHARLQEHVEHANSEHPHLHATASTLHPEALESIAPRLIVDDRSASRA